MKNKLYILSVLFLGMFSANAQLVPSTNANYLKIDKAPRTPVSPIKADSLLLWGTDKYVYHIPVSVLKNQITPNLQEVTDRGQITTNSIAVVGTDKVVSVNSNLLGSKSISLTVDVSTNPALKIDNGDADYSLYADNIKSNVIRQASEQSGYEVVSVNGNLADSDGNVEISAGGGQDLQQTLDIGNTSTTPIILGSGQYRANLSQYNATYYDGDKNVGLYGPNITFADNTKGSYADIVLNPELSDNQEVHLLLPQSSGTLALVSDIGGNDIPLTGTTEGNPVTGDIEMNGNGDALFIYNGNNPSEETKNGVWFTDDGSVGFKSEYGDYLSYFLNQNSQFTLESNNPDFKGIVGDRVYDKQGDPNAYVQKGDLDAAITVDPVPTAGSSNAVSSGGTFTALGTKITNGGQNGTVAIGALDNSFFNFIQNGITRARFGNEDFQLTSGGSFSATNASEGAFFPGSNVASPKISTSRGSSSMPTLIIDNNDSASTGRIIEFRKNGVVMAGVNPDGTVTGANATSTNQFPTLGQVQTAYQVSSSSTLLLTSTNPTNVTTFTGTTATYTLPTIANGAGKRIVIINAGTGSIVLNSNSGANDIWEGGTDTNTTNVMSTLALTIFCDGVKWRIID